MSEVSHLRGEREAQDGDDEAKVPLGEARRVARGVLEGLCRREVEDDASGEFVSFSFFFALRP